MKERPIIFNSEMVKAVLDGRKTQTRRPMSFSVKTCIGEFWYPNEYHKKRVRFKNESEFRKLLPKDAREFCPYGQPGDRLWVRETWNDDDHLGKIEFRADYPQTWDDDGEKITANPEDFKWKPSIHMPREYSRITLEIVNVRVERVLDISYSDSREEGVLPCIGMSACGGGCESCESHNPIQWFQSKWGSIYGKGPHAWDKNPRVWVIEFRRVV